MELIMTLRRLISALVVLTAALWMQMAMLVRDMVDSDVDIGIDGVDNGIMDAEGSANA